MRIILVTGLVVFFTIGCASSAPRNEAPSPEKFEIYGQRMHSVTEFIEGAKLRQAGHEHMRNAYKASRFEDIVYEWDKAVECYGAAADLYYAGKVKYPEFAEYANKELDLTYMFIEQCVKERPFTINPIKGETVSAGDLTYEQRQRIETLHEKIRQYEDAQVR